MIPPVLRPTLCALAVLLLPAATVARAAAAAPGIVTGRGLSLIASANNVFNVPQTMLRYSDETSAYARQNRTSEFGIALALGLKGTF